MMQSILVYGGLAALMYALGRISYARQRAAAARGVSASFYSWEMMLLLGIFSVVSGVRWQVGVDHLNYLATYQEMVRGVDGGSTYYEIGFLLLSKLSADLGLHFTVYFSVIAFLQIFFFYRSFNAERHILPFLGAVLVLGPQYLDWMNGMRQAIAAAIFVFSTKYIFEKRWARYVLTILAASLFHKSALILLPFYIIGNLDLFKSRWMTLGLLFGCMVIGNAPSWLSPSEYFERALLAFGYRGYADNLEYIITEGQQQHAFGPRRVSVTLMWIVIIFYSERLKSFFTGTRFNLLYNLGVLGVLYYNLFAGAGFIFLRPLYYFSIFLPILSAYLLSFIGATNVSGKFSPLRAAIFMLACSFVFLSVLADSNGIGIDYSSYKFYWDYWFPDA